MLYRFGQRIGCVKDPAEPCFASLRRCEQLHAQQRAMCGVTGESELLCLFEAWLCFSQSRLRSELLDIANPLLLARPSFRTCVASSCEHYSIRPILRTWIASAYWSFSLASSLSWPASWPRSGSSRHSAVHAASSPIAQQSFGEIRFFYAASPITRHLVRPDVVSRAENDSTIAWPHRRARSYFLDTPAVTSCERTTHSSSSDSLPGGAPQL